MSRKVKIDGVMELSQAVSYLEDVISSLKQGVIHVEAGQEAITLKPLGVVDFEMSLAQKKEKEKFSLEISWKQGGKAVNGRDLKISS